VNTTEQKYLLLLKTLYDPKSTKAELSAVGKAIAELTETQQVDFNNFQHKVGEVFLQIQADLDKGLDELADDFPEETDPRKWEDEDWVTFDLAVFEHKYEELYRTYAEQKPNLHLMWKEIETRLA
jgi:hypothetical protein